MKTVEFELSTVLKYHNTKDGGYHEDLKKLLLTAPSVQMLKYAAPLKQGFFNQIAKLQTKQNQIDVKTDDSEAKMTAETVLMVLYMGDLNMVDYMESFKKLCTEGVVKLPNGSNVTSYILESLEGSDFELLMGTYIVNFIVGSLMTRAKAS